jgi:hypothetical protein
VPLRNDDLGAGIKRLDGVIAALHLTDEHDPLRLDALRERPRIAEREHQCGRAMGEHKIEQARLFGERPGDEAAAHPLVARRGKFPFEPSLLPVAAADQPEAPRPGRTKKLTRKAESVAPAAA